ncbi:hypothetical protein D8M04_13165 [Oceanobacillus piezotolerans]|uniref:DUF2642 domain-containing protein n=1 Tax=Oceanobacillus piezotolerans TaxID=2448030 RepID=A0A498D5F8_9BACI|nr:hypothetical protein [Oceanobacillus piezotolerans]RLL43853.1 hypothetical protein D8M04_13165 [Oceanobacillus piezotolerans]
MSSNYQESEEQLFSQGADINAIRQAVVTQAFIDHINARALILIAPYPFLVIGTIKEVVSDYLFIKAEVTNINELDGETFRIHIDDIEVFCIEQDGITIPDIRNVRHD